MCVDSGENWDMTDANLLLEPLPNGWKNSQFGEMCQRVNASYKPVDGGDTPYIGLEHLAQGFPAFIGCGTENDIKSSKTAFQAGDILFGKLRPYLRKGARADFDGICSTDILVFRAHEEYEPEFIQYLVHSYEFINHAKSTTTGVQHPRTSWPSLKKFRLSLPPLTEQKKIAHILSTVQRTIEAQERIIQTTTELKKALMQKLFTEGLRGEPQKQTEIGPVPESWEVKKVGEIATLKSGGTPSRKKPEYWDKGNIPWVKTGEVDYCTILDTEEEITSAGLEGSSAKVFPAGTLLMAMYGQGITRGKVALLGIDASTNQACAAFFPNDAIDTKYLYAFFEYSYDAIRNFAHGANQKNLSADIIKSFPISYPNDKKEQREIAKSFAVIDKKIKNAKKKKAVLQGLFRTLLHELMTAKTRVHEVDIT